MKTVPLRRSLVIRVVLLLLLFISCNTSYSQLKIDYGKSYINISKGLAGGTIEPGDTLEIRATFVVSGNAATDYADSCAYFDVIPANTSYIPASLAVLTNEGKVYKSFTDAPGDDAGWISGSNIEINLGFNGSTAATATRRGRITHTDKPSFYNSTCILVASYRVVVTGGFGNKVSVGAGTISVLPYGAPSVQTIKFATDSIMIFKNLGICTNNAGSNTILSEFGGTFGSGTAKNRGPSGKVSSNYIYAKFGPSSPQDYFYNISNNTSTGGVGYTTLNTWPIPDPTIPASSPAQSHRVFNVWDIIGDHTGATNPLLGNPATDTTSSSGGYMAVINSSYKTGIAFLDTVNNLCPNTYYQYTAWFRNICSRCACDSNGQSPNNSGYIPTGPNDSSGVHPNLSFNINGYDYYTTGNILYSGQWIQKGFTYLTGPTQTSMIIFIRNNAPGGGGNDWAIDDIGVATCIPTIALTPNKPDTLCMGSDDTVRFKVTAFTNNYTEWKIEKSIDGGVSWTDPGNDTTGQAATGSAVPVYNSSTALYEYLVTRYYRLNNLDAMITYRLTIASTVGNLTDANCRYISATPKVIRAVDCNIVLPTGIQFSGIINDNISSLRWTSTNETGNIQYSIERSDGDPLHFSSIATVNGTASPGSGAQYHFTDPKPADGQVFYRILIQDYPYQQYSKIILLSTGDIPFDITGLINPFSSGISFNISVPENAQAVLTIFDAYGRRVYQGAQVVSKGLTFVRINDIRPLQTGMYVLQVMYKGQVITKQMIRKPE